MKEGIKDQVKNLPHDPGVYLFRNLENKVIYVGKAKDLKNRVSSYFQSGILPGTKTASLVGNIADLETITVESEIEALVLESGLIKKHRPKYNIVQKDDKSYIYIVIRKSLGYNNVLTARETDLKKEDKIYGPYPNSRIAKDIIRRLRQPFPFKDCSDNKFLRYKMMHKPCLYGHLNFCPSPCVDSTEGLKKTYEMNISRIRAVLSGKSKTIIRELEKLMIGNSNKQNYEAAIHYRELLTKFVYISSKTRDPEMYMENPHLLSDIASEAMKDVRNMLPSLKVNPERIECYDISNISGKESVGSMVVATNGIPDKGAYRRFKIKMKNSPDDYGMLKEVLGRRLRHSYGSVSSADIWSRPSLILIDGGKGQVRAVTEVIKQMGIELPVVGIAKRYETLIYLENDRFFELHVGRSRPGMRLLILLRDEAHRFAQSYHHLLRKKHTIPGV